MTSRLTRPLLEAIGAALDAALAGEGFDGGDFDRMDPQAFERAKEWVVEQQRRRERGADRRGASARPVGQDAQKGGAT